MRLRRFPLFVRLVVAASLVGGLSLVASTAPAGAVTVGAVYTETNTAPNNSIRAFNRDSNGTLTPLGTFATGGAGRLSNPPAGFPVLDSQGAVTLDLSMRYLFAVNAGSDSVSSFRVNPNNSLTLADVEPSMGVGPISVTSFGRYVYVLNSTSIAGFKIDNMGNLTFLPGSSQPLALPADPADIGFDRVGRTLAVTERGSPPIIETFSVAANGVAGPSTPHPSTGPGPFGLAFTPRNQMLVANSGFPSSVSSYAVPIVTPGLTPIDLQATFGAATCWVEITPTGQYAYTTNAGSGTITGLRISTTGTLQLLDPTTGITATTAGLGLDEAISRDGRFLYVLDSSGLSVSKIDVFRIKPNGSLTFIGATPLNLPGGTSGLAVK